MIIQSIPYPAEAVVSGFTGRYFFVEWLTSGNGFIGCSRLQMFDAGGTDHALQANGGTASVVGYTALGGWEVTRVNDGNDGTSTTSTGSAAGSGVGIQIDLGSVETITRIVYRSRHDGSGANEAILTGNIYYKVNVGDAWTLIRTIDELVQSSAEVRDWYLIPYTPSSASWRIAIKSTQSGGFAIAREIEFRETTGGVDTTTGQTATASTANGGAVAANAIDDNSATFWQGTSGTNQWLRVTHGAAKSINEFSWQIHSGIGDGIKEVAVQFLNAEGGWTTWWRPSTLVWTGADEIKVITKP